jgi:hypothetical protein
MDIPLVYPSSDLIIELSSNGQREFHMTAQHNDLLPRLE